MAVQYVNKGAFASGSGALSVAVPTLYTAGNLFLLFVESANETIATPSGWTQVANSPQFTGTSATAGGVRLAVFYKWATSSESAVSVADSGNHTTAIIMEFTGVDPNSPINITAGSVNATATSTITCPSVTTTVDGCLIVCGIGLDKDLADTDTITGTWTNANLTGITERHDQSVSTNVGGGIAVATGSQATAGSTGATTNTADTSTTHAYITVALAPLVEADDGTTLIDSYPESYYDYDLSSGAVGYYRAQSFQALTSDMLLQHTSAWLRKNAQPASQTTGIQAHLYAHSGVYGTSSVPTGSPITTSDTVLYKDLTSIYKKVKFTFPIPPTLSANSYYCIVLHFDIDANTPAYMGGDNASPVHSGNSASSPETVAWSASSTRDHIFWINGTIGSGATTHEASGSGSSDCIGSATATIDKQASATGLDSATGTAVATLTRQASASGSGDIAGSSIATVIKSASGAGSTTSDGSATAIIISQASATGSDTATGSATAIISKQASGSGNDTASGSAIATLTIAATATGADTATGQATATVVKQATASGSSISDGQASATLKIEVSGSGSSSITGAGSATVEGAAPTILEASGSGSSSLTGSATAIIIMQSSGAGSAESDGSASATLIKQASASGQSQTTGSATAFVVLEATASGSTVISATALAVLILEASGHGESEIIGGCYGPPQQILEMIAIFAHDHDMDVVFDTGHDMAAIYDTDHNITAVFAEALEI